MLVMLRIIDTDSLAQIAAFIAAMKLSFKLSTGQTNLTELFQTHQHASHHLSPFTFTPPLVAVVLKGTKCTFSITVGGKRWEHTCIAFNVRTQK